MTPGESRVVLYADGSLDFDLLAQGRFAGFVEKDSDEWADVLESHPLYDYGNLPETVCGFIKLDAFEDLNLVPIDELKGQVESGTSLTHEWVLSLAEASRKGRPFGLEKSSIYYIATEDDHSPPSPEECTNLLRAKVNELHHKIFQFSEFWAGAESSLDKSRVKMRQLKSEKEDAERAITEAGAARDESTRSSQSQKIRRLYTLIESHFPNLDFRGNSLDTLVNYYARNDAAWDALEQLNRIGKMQRKIVREIKPFKGTKQWTEVKLSGTRRMYHRKAPGGSRGTWVLVSRRSHQGGPDTNYMKKYDGD